MKNPPEVAKAQMGKLAKCLCDQTHEHEIGGQKSQSTSRLTLTFQPWLWRVRPFAGAPNPL
jgi:hypothetical protein